MKDIIIIQQEPLTKRTKKIFCIDELLDAGFNIKYWNMSQYFHPGMTLMDELTEDYCIEINSLDELQEKLQNIVISNTVFIIEVFDYWKNRRFFKLLKQSECFTIKLELYATISIPISRLSRFIRENYKKKFRMMYSYLTHKLYWLYRKMNCLNSYDVEISSKPSLNCKQSVFINHPDFEQVRLNNQKNNLINTKYAVFLDEYFPLHPDMKYYLKKEIDYSKSVDYLKWMCNFFDIIESQYDVKVIIAAHPKSKYTREDFGNRPVLKHVTGQLIQYAQFSILHSSTSVAYAALLYCPLLICYTRDYENVEKSMFELAYKYSKIFKAPFIKVEESMESTLPTPNIDHEACNNYKYTYLTKPEIETLENKDIIIQYFKHLSI